MCGLRLLKISFLFHKISSLLSGIGYTHIAQEFTGALYFTNQQMVFNEDV